MLFSKAVSLRCLGYRCVLLVLRMLLVVCFQENLFTDGGLRSEISAIRELLDTGGGMLWGNQTGGLSILTLDCTVYLLGLPCF